MEIVIPSEEFKPDHSLGRNDLTLSVDYLGRESSGDVREPFTQDWKSGVPPIANSETLERVTDCHRRGLIPIEENCWGRSWPVLPELVETMGRQARRIDLPSGSQIHAFEWDHGGDAAGCTR